MTLLRPWLLLLLLPWLIGWWWTRRRERSAAWSRLIQPQLLQALDHEPGRDPIVQHWLLGLAGVLIIVALAGPAQSQATSTRLSHGNLVVLLDVSLSMAAEDLVPSRLERARRVVFDWADSGLFERTAVIVYSASAHWLMPLTEDAQTLALQLEQLDPFEMPRYGNRPELAFQLLAQKQSQLAGAPLHRLWLTDDPASERLADIDTANNSGHTWIMPVGTENGGPIPLPNGDGFVTDADRMVVANLDRDAFEQAAKRLDATLLGLGSQPQSEWLNARRSVRSSGASLTDLGPWLLLPALLLLLPWYRRGLVFAVPLLVVLTGQPTPAMAAEPWWHNAEQRAYDAWRNGDIARSRALTQRPELLGQLAFDAGDYATAADAWSQSNRADDHYNRGNALVNLGELEAALAAYDQALALGEHPAAQYNRQLVADFLAQQNTEQDSQPQSAERQPTPDSLHLDPNEPAEQRTEDDEASAEQRIQNARLDQLLNRIPPPRGNLLERRLQQEYRQAPVDDAGATLW
ncbi:VWA domain-containing protein [Saccharospirillum mangrovi]|uniref:VWA domain-containing protein n=1 Tax=Saccharospirillum mangrovi TaxID=2161747 RepID=UPI000D37BC00|nr:VWA domain-containing protein [Saccharospirillum mangrovi]